MNMHDLFMKEAIREAEKAAQIDEVPIGAVVVYQGEVIARGHNLREKTQNPITHAEILVIQSAAELLQSWRLEGCALYVTLEPCPMCAGAILQARIPQLIYGTPDPKAGCVDSLYHLLQDKRLNHQTEVIAGIQQQTCSQLLTHFFRQLRSRNKAKKH